MLNAQFRPLDHWPGERTKWRKDATFRSTYPQTLDLLETELSKLSARAGSVVIQVENLTLKDIRNDGSLRSWKLGERGYGGPGVIVTFESSKGVISMPCDKFGDWQDNLRAIAKSLEALRMVDRYGVTRGNEQYRGWAKLEAPNGNGKMDRDAALRFLASLHSSPVENLARLTSDQLRAICRTAKIENHPDRTTGLEERARCHEIFVKIGQAEEVLCQ